MTKNKKQKNKKEDISDLYKRNKKQRASKRHKEKGFMKEIQKRSYDVDNLDNFEKW